MTCNTAMKEWSCCKSHFYKAKCCFFWGEGTAEVIMSSNLFWVSLSFQLRALSRCEICERQTNNAKERNSHTLSQQKTVGRVRANAISSELKTNSRETKGTSQVRPGSCHLTKLVLTTGKINRHSEIRILFLFAHERFLAPIPFPPDKQRR